MVMLALGGVCVQLGYCGKHHELEVELQLGQELAGTKVAKGAAALKRGDVLGHWMSGWSG